MANKRAVQEHYGRWASTYATPQDDGWFNVVRQREVRAIRALLALRGGESILDAGCGSGLHSVPLHEQGHEVWAVDFTPQMLEQVKGKVSKSVLSDLEELELGRRFDRVLCVGVLDFVEDAREVLRRLALHMDPGGILVVLAPRASPAGLVYAATKRRHGLSVRLYSRKLLRELAHGAGFAFLKEMRPAPHNVAMSFRRAGKRDQFSGAWATDGPDASPLL